MHKKLVGFNIYKNQRTPQIWSISYFLGTFVEKTNEKKKKLNYLKDWLLCFCFLAYSLIVNILCVTCI